MDRKNAVIAVLILLLVFSMSTFYLIYHQQRHTIGVQEDMIRQLLDARNTETIRTEEVPIFIDDSGGTSSSRANIVAVRSDTRLGVLGKVQVTVKEGTGNVLVNTNPFVESDTQYSIREAVEVAENVTHMDVSNKDIIISFDINGTVIGGPSAGAATTVATIAAIEGKQARQDVAITGTIEEGGYIGQVSGVFDKAVAAEQNGMTLFLVPYSQSRVEQEKIEENEIQNPFFPFFGPKLIKSYRIYYVPVNLEEYMGGKMAVEEVSTIDEAVAYMIL